MPPVITEQSTPARVVLFTADASVTADLATGGHRVKDVLNEPQALLELTRLTYSNPDRPGVPLVDYPAGQLRKVDVGVVVVLSEPAAPPMRRMGVYVQKTPVRVSLLLPGMVVVGTLHISGRYDPSLVLTDAPEPFIPLTDAGVVRARSTTPTNVPPERLTVFVNRLHISGVLLQESPDRGVPSTSNLHRQQHDLEPAMAGAGDNATGRLRRFAVADLAR